MADDRQEVVRLLRSIDASLQRLCAAAGGVLPTGAALAAAVAADDRDLDSKYGDPEIRTKDPRDWLGASMRGRHFSECPPEYLDLYADLLEFMARKSDEKHELSTGGKPVSEFRRKDAARARGWARRMRAGLCHRPTDRAPDDSEPLPPLEADGDSGQGWD